MKRFQWIQLIFICLCLSSLTACHTNRKPNYQSEVNQANAAYEGGARSYGAGEESSFGDNATQGRHAKNTYYFDYDSNVVHEQDKPAIMANAQYLRNHPQARVLLEGHTDPRGSREYNIGLGERRAKAVAQLLTSNGVSASQVRIVSYGAEKLAALGRTEADYQLDRRVVLVYLQR